MLASIVGQGVILIEASVSRMSNQIGMLLTKVVGYSVSELPGCFGIAVVVILAPGGVYFEDAAGGAVAVNPPIRPGTEAFLCEADHRAVAVAVILPGVLHGFRLRKTIAIVNHCPHLQFG